MFRFTPAVLRRVPGLFVPSRALCTPQVHLRETFLQLDQGSGSPPLHFHYLWLRHNCPDCIHEKTKERLIDSPDFPLSIRPKHAAFHDQSEELELVWDDGEHGHRSIFSLEFLKTWAYSRVDASQLGSVSPPEGDARKVTVDYEVLQGDKKEYLTQVGDRLARFGAVVVRGRGLDTEEIIQEMIQDDRGVWESHFGRIEELRTDNTTNKHTDQLGYTNAAVDLHTDQPFVEAPPRFQMLHCIQKAERGGENYVVDAKQAALYLAFHNRIHFSLLSSIEVSFHRKQKDFERILKSPIISLRASERRSKIDKIRYSYFTMDPHMLPFSLTEEFYASYEHFAKILRKPEHQLHAALQPGDFLLYDNHRMLHARKAFTGSRVLRGVYFEEKFMNERIQKELAERIPSFEVSPKVVKLSEQLMTREAFAQ